MSPEYRQIMNVLAPAFIGAFIGALLTWIGVAIGVKLHIAYSTVACILGAWLIGKWILDAAKKKWGKPS